MCNWTGVACAGGDVDSINLAFIGGNATSRLRGPLPTFEEVTFPDMDSLSLGGNVFSGTLPAEWAQQPSLMDVDLSGNNLTGTLPAAWGRSQFYILKLTGNPVTVSSQRCAHARSPYRWHHPQPASLLLRGGVQSLTERACVPAANPRTGHPAA